ncbi:MAG: DUF1178 family protein [Mangrovicoccus sp.]
MIRYALKCDQNHSFESWFQSASAYDALHKSNLLECPVCGSSSVQKAMMAPRVSISDTAERPAPPSEAQAETPAAATEVPAPAPAPLPNMPVDAQVKAAVDRLRHVVESNSDYVGNSFAEEARAMHEGTAPERAIHGEAKLEDARSLLEDGVPILPLPFRSRGGSN